MRRLLVTFALAVTVMAQLPAEASATGRGGWDHVGHGSTASAPALNGAVYALAPNAGILYAGGAFSNAGGRAAADHLAAWNGSSWAALGPVGLNGNVRAIAVAGGKVIVGGNFTDAGGNADLDFLAQWNGSNWSSPCSVPNATTAAVLALQVIGNTLYIGGSFANGAGLSAADFLLACDLTTGAPSSTVSSDGDINSGVLALTADSNGVLYAGGSFINMDGIAAADHIASFDGAWHAMGSAGAVDDKVRALGASGTDVYAGTDSLNVAGIAQADHVARWNGAAWSAVGANTAGTDGWFPAITFIDAIVTSSGSVFASGSFQNADGLPTADRIARFDGSTWHPLGSDGAGDGALDGNDVGALARFGVSICAGGNFTDAGGDALAGDLACYALLRPDARIGLAAAGPFSGNNVYSSTGAGESRSIQVNRGGHGTLFVDLQNDGFANDTFSVHGTGTANGFTVSYFKGATNVTAQVLAGTFSTGPLAPGGHVTLKVVVRLSSTSGNVRTFVIRARAPGEAQDGVQAVVHAH